MSITKYRQHSFNAGVISPLLYTRVAQDRYRNSCIELHNMLLYPQGGVYRRPGFEYIGEIGVECRLIPFVYNSEQSYILEWSEYKLRIWYQGELVRDQKNNILEISSPYSYNVLSSIQYVQTENTMYLVSSSIRAYILERKGHDEWILQEFLFGATHKAPSNVEYEGGEASTACTKIIIRGLDKEGRESASSEVLSVPKKASLEFPIRYTWASDEGSERFHIYRQEEGDDAFRLCFVTSQKTFEDYGFPFKANDLRYVIRGPYNGEGSYPTTVALWQQRLIFAGSLYEPQTLWFSKVGSYDTFLHSEQIPDDDPITVSIASSIVEPIQWIYTYRDVLFIGTALGEWSVYGYGGNAITPRTVSIKRHTSYGSCLLPPLHVGDAMMFIQKDRRVVRQLQYSMEYDSFIGKNLSILAEHITQDARIIGVYWQQYPHPVVWLLLDNGKLAGLTFIQEYGIFAWHTHATEGIIESMVSLPNGEDIELYAVIRRTIQGHERRYLERLYNMAPFDDIERGRFLDSYIEYKGEQRTELEGLEHLEGESLYVVADGRIEKKKEVKEGRIILEHPAKHIYAGIPYISYLIPSLCLQPQAESKDDMLYSVVKIAVTTTNTYPFFISGDEQSKVYQSAFIGSKTEQRRLYTYKVNMPSQSSREYTMIIKQYMPVQMKITAITADFCI